VCFVKNILVSPLQETPTSVQILVEKKRKRKKTLVGNPTKIVAGAGLW
jgi:hypothetical protein